MSLLSIIVGGSLTSYEAPFIKRGKDKLKIIRDTERFVADRRKTVNEITSIAANGRLEQHAAIVGELLEDEAPFWSDMLSRQYVRKHFPESELMNLFQVTKGLMLASVYMKENRFDDAEKALLEVARYLEHALHAISVQVKYLENGPRPDRQSFDAELKRDARKKVALPSSLERLRKVA